MKNIALITGGTSGIGKAVAFRFAENGYTTLITGRNEEKGKAVREEINTNGGDCYFFHLDLSSKQKTDELFDTIKENYGILNVACNNAGTDEGATGVFTADIDEDNFNMQMEINLKSVWRCMKKELKLMQKSNSGSIVNISSINGLGGTVGAAAYSVSRHGIISLTKTAALEYAKMGIRVNVVCPGMIHTPMLERVMNRINPGDANSVKLHLENSIPLGKIGTPEDIAESVFFLASEKARYISGHTMIIDGGLTAQFR